MDRLDVGDLKVLDDGILGDGCGCLMRGPEEPECAAHAALTRIEDFCYEALAVLDGCVCAERLD